MRELDPLDQRTGATLLEAAQAVADEVLGGLREPLGSLVAKTSQTYNLGREDLTRASSREALQARLRFFFFRDVTKVWPPLGELFRAGGLPEDRPWRVLDLGAGLGTTGIGAGLFARQRGASITIEAIDRDALALRCLSRLAEHLGIEAIVRQGDALEAERSRGRYDLILVGLMLNELPRDKRRQLVESLIPKLEHGGSIVIIEPALREVTRELHALRDELEQQSWTIFAPCLRHGGCPMLETKRDWCHEEIPFRLPPELAEVARSAGLRFERLTYSYLTLRRDGKRLRDTVHGSRVVSAALVSKGKREIFICDELGRRKLTRLDRHASASNELFAKLQRGDVMSWEAPKEAAKLRIGPDDIVELAP